MMGIYVNLIPIDDDLLLELVIFMSATSNMIDDPTFPEESVFDVGLVVTGVPDGGLERDIVLNHAFTDITTTTGMSGISASSSTYAAVKQIAVTLVKVLMCPSSYGVYSKKNYFSTFQCDFAKSLQFAVPLRNSSLYSLMECVWADRHDNLTYM